MTKNDLGTLNMTVITDTEREPKKVNLKAIVAERASKDMLDKENLLATVITVGKIEHKENVTAKEQYVKNKGLKLAKNGHAILGKEEERDIG